MSGNKLLVLISMLLILASLSLQEQVRMTGKAAYEIGGAFTVVDESPRLLQLISNYTVKPSQNRTVSINLSAYFKEPNGENLTYSFAVPSSITVSLNNATGEINLTLSQGWKGKTINVTFTAFDSSNNNVTSNNITIMVKEINITASTFDSVTAIGWYEGQSSGRVAIASLTDGELENSTELTIEKYAYGKMLFAEPINISEDADLDSNINISDNSIILNSLVLANFNKPAMLWFYNLSFTNPRILKDGAACAATECAKINYTASTGILILNVTGFAAYSSEETPAVPAPVQAPSSETPSSAAGSSIAPKRSSGGAVPKVDEVEIDVSRIITDVKQNRVKKEAIKVSNPTDKEVEIRIDSTPDLGFIHADKEVIVSPGETKDIEITIAPTEENKPDTYTTQFALKGVGRTKLVPLVVNVQAFLQLLDMEMDIYSENAEVSPRDNLLAGLKIYNLGESGKISVAVEWKIKDFNNNVIAAEKATADVGTEAVLVQKIFIPSTVEPGDYVLVAIASYDGSEVVASETFKVVNKPAIERPLSPTSGIVVLLAIVIIALAAVIVLLIIILIREDRKINAILQKKSHVSGVLK